MSAGPLRRIIGVLGLLALVPIAISLATGSVAVEDAATRAVAVGVAVVIIGRVARVVLSATLRHFESAVQSTEPDDQLVS
ncbi:hypothetical protein [Nitriliruptor alkaliphilus]|uniref:hypothetical protein n=1 Tax=Nitriliruptor alkaliphilus TaxID=427918 RepID=UPI000698806F|nr:hypothetical protein [Nitriliruptor alkaliphilus]